jgi:hypothetical protein
MKKLIAILIVASVVFVGFMPSVLAEIDNKHIEEVLDSVMMVRGPTGLGSGVVVNLTNADTNNYMLTAYHVIKNTSGIDEMTLIKITDRHGNEYKAEIVMTDRANDLAMIRLIAGEFSCKPVDIAKPSWYEVGDEIFSVGYNLQGFEEATRGGLNPKENITKNPVPRVGFGNISDIRPGLVYIDIGCYSWGSSGGGTFTKRGKLIGINSLLLGDGAGKVGMIRPVQKLGFDVYTPPEAKKKLADITFYEKHQAIIAAITADAHRPAYYYRRSPVYLVRYILTDHYLSQGEIDEDLFQIWMNEAGRPDEWWIEFHVGGAVGLHIAEIRKWNHPGYGYEKYIYNIQVGYEFDFVDGKMEYGDIDIWGYPSATYVVCSEEGIILNTHGPGCFPPEMLEKSEALPIAKRWTSWIWKERCIEHFRGVEE